MLYLIATKGPQSALVAFLATLIAFAIIGANHAVAATDSMPIDQQTNDLQDKLNEVISTPFDFCDPSTEAAHRMAILKASASLFDRRLAIHPSRPGDLKRAEDRAVQANNADGGALVNDLPYIAEYEEAARHGDKARQAELFAKMTPAAQGQAAEHDHNYPVAIKALTPLAEAGDVVAELRLAGMYNFATTGMSAKYLPPLDTKVLKILEASGTKWPPVEPPEILPLAYRYLRMAASKGDFFGQSGLARAYACGFGVEKNYVLAYMWFSVALAQRGVTDDVAGAAVRSGGSEKDYAVDRDFILAMMKPDKIEQGRALASRCRVSLYRDCQLSQ